MKYAHKYMRLVWMVPLVFAASQQVYAISSTAISLRDSTTHLPVLGATVTIVSYKATAMSADTPCTSGCELASTDCGLYFALLEGDPYSILLSVEREFYVSPADFTYTSGLPAVDLEEDPAGGGAAYFAAQQYFWIADPANIGDISEALLIVDAAGNVHIKGSWYYAASISASGAQEFLVKKSDGSVVFKLDDAGNLITRTDNIEGEVDSGDLKNDTEQEFRIENDEGDTVFRIRHGNIAGGAGMLQCAGCLAQNNDGFANGPIDPPTAP